MDTEVGGARLRRRRRWGWTARRGDGEGEGEVLAGDSEMRRTVMA